MQHIIICDDQPQVLSHLTKMIGKVWTRPHTVLTFTSGAQLEEYLLREESHQADILFMDIKLGDDNGISLSQRIMKQHPRIRMIFFTGYIEYAEDIFYGKPTAFLVKPIKPDKLLFALEKATDELEEADARSILLKSRAGESVRVSLNEILYIESNGRIARFSCTDRVVECYRKLAELEQLLNENFLRCHQSYLVNLHFVSRVDKDKIYLTNGQVLPISKSRAKLTRERMLHFAGQSL